MASGDRSSFKIGDTSKIKINYGLASKSKTSHNRGYFTSG